MKIKRVFAAVLAALTLSAAAVSLTACGGTSNPSSGVTASSNGSKASSGLETLKEYIHNYTPVGPGGGTTSSNGSGTTGSSASPTYPYTSYGSDNNGGTVSSYGGGTTGSYSGETPSSLEGTKWILSKVSLNGVEMDAAEFIRFSQINYDEMTLEFKNGKVYSTGTPSYSAPNYVYKDGKLTTEGSSGTVNGNVMTFENNGNSMIYVRQ